MLKESNIKRETSKKSEKTPPSVEWEPLDLDEIRKKAFQYYTEKGKENLSLVENNKWPKEGYYRKYADNNGKIIRSEERSVFDNPEDYESSERLMEKEYYYSDNGSIETIRYNSKQYSNYDQITSSEDRVGEINYEYSEGRVVKAHIKEVCEGYSEWHKEGDKKYGKESVFHFIYGKNGEIIQVVKEENNFGENKIETSIFYEKERDKELVFKKMNAMEMIEWEFTRRNDLKS